MMHAATFTAGLLAGCFGAAWLIGWFLSSSTGPKTVGEPDANFRWPQ